MVYYSTKYIWGKETISAVRITVLWTEWNYFWTNYKEVPSVYWWEIYCCKMVNKESKITFSIKSL